jgi:hypothetical protein
VSSLVARLDGADDTPTDASFWEAEIQHLRESWIDRNQYSRNRLLREATENADGVDPSKVSAHRLRVTGETFLAEASVGLKML